MAWATLNCRVIRLTDHIRVQFDGNTVTTTGFSVLRINLDNPPGEVAIFSGNAHLEGGNTIALDLHGGESVKLNGADPGNYALSEAIEPDSWDAWNSDRDQALTSQEADRTVATNSVPNSNNPAWSDLDANGNWYNVPGQGYVWSPYEAQNAGWDPYGCGSWVSTPAYGYGWASCEPWGFMPYNSGLWNYYDGFGWGWEPGFGGPWWGGGGWVSNIGNAPFRYHPPIRPRSGPVRPGGGSVPIRAGGRYEPNPVIAVNRMHYTAAGPPIRTKGSPVTVAGNTVQPLRPIASRPTYTGDSQAGLALELIREQREVSATAIFRARMPAFTAARQMALRPAEQGTPHIMVAMMVARLHHRVVAVVVAELRPAAPPAEVADPTAAVPRTLRWRIQRGRCSRVLVAGGAPRTGAVVVAAVVVTTNLRWS